MHWTQTPEGKRRLAERREARSKAELVVKKHVGKKAIPNRHAIYERAVSTAVAANEVRLLMNLLSHRVLLQMVGEK